MKKMLCIVLGCVVLLAGCSADKGKDAVVDSQVPVATQVADGAKLPEGADVPEGAHLHPDGTVHYGSHDAAPNQGSELAQPSATETQTITTKDGTVVTIPLPPKAKAYEAELVKAESVAASLLSDYDNKVLEGDAVKSLLSRFKDKRVALLVATQMVVDSTVAYSEFDGNVASDVPSVGVKGLSDFTNTLGQSMKDKFTFVNYGAVLKGEGGKSSVTYADGYYIAEGLALNGDSVEFNADQENTTKQGMVEYISEQARFQVNLVKDSKGTVVGVACQAVK